MSKYLISIELIYIMMDKMMGNKSFSFFFLFLTFLFRWFCDFVEFKNLQTNQIKCFSVHQWLDQSSDRLHFSMTNYQNISCDDQQDRKHHRLN